jgi:tetratricopeptide (TPR) repeat protein
MKRLLAITILALATTTAAAQPKPDVAALEASGNKHFELAEYDAAITDFKEAFRISDEPGFLYNIAQAYRLKRDCREAATFYKTYLRRVPSAPNAAKVRERITEMEECAKTQPAPVVTTPTTPTPTTPTPTEPVDEPEEPVEQPNPRAWMKWAGIGSLGAGAISLGLGVKFMLDGSAADDELKDKCATSCTPAEAKAIEDDGKAANRNAVIASIAGGVFVAGGVVFLVLSRGGGSGDSAEEPAVSFSLTRGGATASYGWTF